MVVSITKHAPMKSPPSTPELSVCSGVALALPDGNQLPSWVQLLPAGSVRPNDGRPEWTLTDPGGVIAASLAAAPRGLLAIDYDHAADIAVPKGGTAPAAGWITALESRSDGIWGKVDWTQSGAHAIASKEYRFLSPSFLHTPERVITRIVGAGLTNRPALTSLPALASSQGDMMNPMLTAILDALGLPADADQSAVLAAIAKLKGGSVAVTAAAVPDPALYVPRSLYDQASASLAAMQSNLSAEQATVKVDEAIRSGLMTPAQREWGLALCRQNPASFDAFTRVAPPVFANLTREIVVGQPAGGQHGASALTEDQKALCARLQIDPADFAKNL